MSIVDDGEEIKGEKKRVDSVVILGSAIKDFECGE